MNRAIVLLLGAGFLLFPSCILSADGTHNPENYIIDSIQAYHDLKTYQDKTTIVMTIDQNNEKKSEEMNYNVFLKNPDKMAVITETPTSGLTLIYDGSQLVTYIPSFKKYTAEPMVLTVSDAISKSIYSRNLLPGNGIFPVKMLMASFIEKLKSEYPTIEYIQSTEINSETVDHLRLTDSKNEITVDLYFSKESHLLKKLTADMSALAKKQSPRGNLKSMQLEELHSEVRINEKLDEASFTFVPPGDVEKTDDLFKQNAAPGPKTGESMKPFVLDTLKDQEKIDSSVFKGKVVMIDFWATWCGPCRMELPILEKVYQKYKDKNFIFVAVNVGENKAKVQDFLTKQKLNVPVALDPDNKVAMSYQISGFPSLLLIDTKGVIQNVHVGLEPGLENKLIQEIDKLLDGGNHDGKK